MELTGRHVAVLAWLRSHRRDTPEDIARGLRIDLADIVRVCEELAQAGLIIRPQNGN
jgi:DNA-binding MarR family transcriptional regulator